MPLWPLVFLVMALPTALLAAYFDMRFMRIPNRLVLVTAALFIILGPFVLPLGDYGWRLLAGFIVLAIGFGLHMTGRVGGGDIKYAAAIIPTVASHDLLDFLLILSIASLLGVLLHRIIRAVGLAPQGWISWQRAGLYPFGLSLAAAQIGYLAIKMAQLAG